MVWTPSTHNYFSPRHQLPLGCLLSLCAWSPVEMRFGVIWAENSRYVFWGLALWRTAQASTVFISLVPQMPVTWESHNWNKNRGRLFKTEYLEQNISIFCGNKLQKKHLKERPNLGYPRVSDKLQTIQWDCKVGSESEAELKLRSG